MVLRFPCANIIGTSDWPWQIPYLTNNVTLTPSFSWLKYYGIWWYIKILVQYSTRLSFQPLIWFLSCSSSCSTVTAVIMMQRFCFQYWCCVYLVVPQSYSANRKIGHPIHVDTILSTPVTFHTEVMPSDPRNCCNNLFVFLQPMVWSVLAMCKHIFSTAYSSSINSIPLSAIFQPFLLLHLYRHPIFATTVWRHCL